MAKKYTFFLGANSGSGFSSLYDQLRPREDMRDLIVLKGGPGVGKSTFMKHIGARAEQLGMEVEYIRCSGDPSSLDAVILPEVHAAVADGTAPHVIEPVYPAAVDRYVNLGCFYDVDRLKERRREVVACTEGYRKEYDRAYPCLRACRAVRQMNEESLTPWVDRTRLRRRLQNIWQRERGRKRRGAAGRERLRFLGGLTPKGRVACTESIAALCPKIYELRDPYHLAAPVLEEVRRAILQDGFDLIVCRDPDAPERIAHLLAPEAGVALVTTGLTLSLPQKPWRRVHITELADREVLTQLRGGLRLKERLAAALEEEGAEHLRLAGEKHDELELIYHPFVDFDGVLAAAESESRRILAS